LIKVMQRLIASDWEMDSNQRLSQAMDQLDERSRDILQQRWLNEPKATLHTLADQYQISAERIRQLEKNAMQKIKQAMIANIIIFNTKNLLYSYCLIIL